MPIDELGLVGLLDEYWDLAYSEGQRGATTDTPSGDAQRVRSALSAAIERLLAERDEARESTTVAQSVAAALGTKFIASEAQRDKLKEALTYIDAYITQAASIDASPVWTTIAARAHQALQDSKT